jgi:autotransporter passenger strand-loop-strand repeat protein
MAISTTVNSGGIEDVVGDIIAEQGYGPFNYSTTYYDQDPGFATFTTVNSGGFQVISGGGATGTTVNSGGTEIVAFLGTAADTVLNAGGAIDVTTLPYASGGLASVDASDLLTVSVGSQSYTQQLVGTYAEVHFQLTGDTSGGTVITLEAGEPGSGFTFSSGTTSGITLTRGGVLRRGGQLHKRERRRRDHRVRRRHSHVNHAGVRHGAGVLGRHSERHHRGGRRHPARAVGWHGGQHHGNRRQ